MNSDNTTPPAPSLADIFEAATDYHERGDGLALRGSIQGVGHALYHHRDAILAALRAAEYSPAMTAQEFAAKFGIDAEALIAERKRESDEAKLASALLQVCKESAKGLHHDTSFMSGSGPPKIWAQRMLNAAEARLKADGK